MPEVATTCPSTKSYIRTLSLFYEERILRSSRPQFYVTSHEILNDMTMNARTNERKEKARDNLVYLLFPRQNKNPRMPMPMSMSKQTRKFFECDIPFRISFVLYLTFVSLRRSMF